MQETVNKLRRSKVQNNQRSFLHQLDKLCTSLDMELYVLNEVPASSISDLRGVVAVVTGGFTVSAITFNCDGS